MQVDHTFKVRGVGSVVSGTAVTGSIAVGQRLLLGPNADGDFTNIVVTGIQRSQVQFSVQCRCQCYLKMQIRGWQHKG